MNMLKKAMASIGIGSTRIDAILESSRVVVGDEINGKIVIRGGSVPQELDYINLYVMTRYEREFNDHTVVNNAVIQQHTIKLSTTINENEVKEIPFSFVLSNRAPISMGRTPIWINTGLEIKNAVDPTDHDSVEVLPSHNMQTVLNALEEMGFRLRKVKNEEARFYGAHFIQNFEYVPTSEFYGYLDELEVAFLAEKDYLELLMEVDRRARGFGGMFAEAMDADESKVRIRLSNSDFARGADYVKEQIRSTISRYAR